MSYNIQCNIHGYEFVRYEDLTNIDSRQVLSCRNHPNVRKWMLNSSIIPEENHMEFVKSLKNSPNKVYCAVFRKSKLIGCIYYDKINQDIYSTGFFLNPSIISSGIGLYFEYIYLHFFFKFLNAKEIYARVIPENTPVRKIHKSCGFIENLELGKELIYYSLSKKMFETLPININVFIRKLIENYED